MALQKHHVRQVYLITYSQADLVKFPTRESFADAIIDAFSSKTPASVIQWVCAREQHQTNGEHYHMALKLDRVQRWLRVKQHLQQSHSIVVHFSSNHVNYYSAWLYVTKEDAEHLHSPDHPILANPPQTLQASQANSQRSGDGVPTKKVKKVRLTGLDVGEICIASDVKNRLQLLALANRLKQQGKTDLAEFIYKRGKKAVDEVISTAWEMAGAEEAIERAQMRRVDILRDSLHSDCVEGCDGAWIRQAKDILSRNSIPEELFCTGVISLLHRGRGKYRNVLVTGPTNCGKTFILRPLTTIFKTFSNPATTTYAWIGAEAAEIILLNDFRWSPQVIIKCSWLCICASYMYVVSD